MEADAPIKFTEFVSEKQWQGIIECMMAQKHYD